MKQSIRAFALGLLSAGIILLISFIMSDSGKTEELTVDQMVKVVEENGYHVMTESEYISVSVEENDDKEKEKKDQKEDKQPATENKKKDESANEKVPSNQSQEEEKPTTYTLTIESGMAPSTISDVLQKNGIIENADEFTKYLEEQDYSTKVQLGEFKLNSEMSHYEIAETLTN
ncbi:hypothetical protein ACFO3D_11415 [Virgibacillus kekensis]|uniref:Endolytic transglycosylase MltG n=1 Tax=Virgibacillus kekensis TaxID=202261 RepID=A0ABV9DKI0_9BACI